MECYIQIREWIIKGIKTDTKSCQAISDPPLTTVDTAVIEEILHKHGDSGEFGGEFRDRPLVGYPSHFQPESVGF
jgi:hypothetical protein